MTPDEKRHFFVGYAMRFLGTWYSWGGNDPMAGFDCSGFVIECLQAVGKFPRGDDTTADGLMRKYDAVGCKVSEPDVGVILFYLDSLGRAYHVEICLNDELSIGAKNGGSRCITKADAISMDAFIKVRPIKGDRLVYMDVFNGSS